MATANPAAAASAFAPPLTPDGEALKPGTIPHHALTFALMLATIVQVLDTTIANVALPHMQTSLGATYDTVTWVLTSYIVAAAVAIPITGWLADRVGRRRLFLFAITGFVASSMLCGIATSLEEMVMFRIFQGITGAFISPLGQAVMLDINPQERHGKAMAVWGMGVMVAPIVGPVLGGVLTEQFDWRWVFFVNVPIGALCLLLLFMYLPDQKKPKRGFDLFGFALLALGLASLQLMLDRGQGEDWLQSTEVMIELGLAVAGLWMFGVHMATGRRTLFPRTLLMNRNLMAGVLLMAIAGVAIFANMAILPPMLQNLYGYSVIQTGLLLAPRGVGILFTMWVAGQLLGRIDPRILIVSGLLITSFSLWLMTGWSLDQDFHPIIWSGVIQGLGMGLIFVPVNATAFATLDPSQRTDGSSLLNLSRSLGGSIGISLVVTMLARGSQRAHEIIGSHVTQAALGPLGSGEIARLGSIADSAAMMVNAEVTRQAMMIGYLDDFHLMMLSTLAAIPFALVMKPAKPGAPPPPPMGE